MEIKWIDIVKPMTTLHTGQVQLFALLKALI